MAAILAVPAGPTSLGELALGLIFCAMLVVVTLTDLQRRLIPDVVLLAGALLAMVLVATTDPGSLGVRVIAAAGAGGFMFLVALAYPRGMGMGDVKLVAVMGLYVGRAVAPALLIAFAAGTVVGLAMIARRGTAARKQAVPFGPFLALGGLVALWYGNAIVEWYLDSLFDG